MPGAVESGLAFIAWLQCKICSFERVTIGALILVSLWSIFAGIYVR